MTFDHKHAKLTLMKSMIYILGFVLSFSAAATDCQLQLVTKGPDGTDYLASSALKLSDIQSETLGELKKKNYKLSADAKNTITIASADITYDRPLRMLESYFLIDIQTEKQNLSEEGHGRGLSQRYADKKALQEALKKVISNLYKCDF